MPTHLVWFRADLRVHDNTALAAACRAKDANVLALFIATPEQWRQHDMAPRQAALLRAWLNDLQHSLAEKGIPLIYREVSDFAAQLQTVQEICQQNEVTHLFYNYQYELNERQRDRQLESILKDVQCQGFDDSVMLAPGSVMTGGHEMYKVFTPFKNAFVKRLKEALPECVVAPAVRGDVIADLPELTFNYPQQAFNALLIPENEKSAIAKLRQFCKQGAGEYDTRRDFPAIEGTSRLSACLALGVLSPRQCLHRLLAEQPQALDGGVGSVWLNELIWREFYRHLMTYHPDLCKHRPFIPWTDNVKWQYSETLLQAWQKGETGYPIVDAAMRQLNATVCG